MENLIKELAIIPPLLWFMSLGFGVIFYYAFKTHMRCMKEGDNNRIEYKKQKEYLNKRAKALDKKEREMIVQIRRFNNARKSN